MANRGESQSMIESPFFDGSNYGYWKMKMITFLDSHDDGGWVVIKNDPYEIVDKDGVEKLRNTWIEAEKKLNAINQKAMNALSCGLSPEEVNRTSKCKYAQTIWHTLEVTYAGTNTIKKSKIGILMSKYEEFKIESFESIT